MGGGYDGGAGIRNVHTGVVAAVGLPPAPAEQKRLLATPYAPTAPYASRESPRRTWCPTALCR
eukprot:7066693-Lingulodinium_polyedra.AAC.1